MKRLPKYYRKPESVFLKITKYFLAHLILFGASIFSIAALFLVIANDDIDIPQKDIVTQIDIQNKINICLPDDNPNE